MAMTRHSPLDGGEFRSLLTEVIEIVGILIARGNGEHARAEYRRRVRRQQRIAWVCNQQDTLSPAYKTCNRVAELG